MALIESLRYLHDCSQDKMDAISSFNFKCIIHVVGLVNT